MVTTAIASASYIQLHDGDPGSSGTANQSSVTTREQVAWGTVSGGSVTASNTPSWTNWAGTNGETVTDTSFWSQLTSGNFQFSGQLGTSVTMDTGDSLELTSITFSVPVAS
jgi:hypothetical protein